MTYRVVDVADVPWDDVRTVFGTRGDPSTCFCQFFKVDNATWKATKPAAFEQALCDQARQHPGPGLLAYDDATPVGWVAVEPRTAYVRIVDGALEPDAHLPAEQVWVVSCFVVRVGHRRKGVARALLDGAIDHARAHGAAVIEAHPVDGSQKVSSAELYHGPLSAFEDAGFEVVARPSSRRAQVRLALT